MTTPSLTRLNFALLAAVACALLAIPGFAESQVRIVRLSDVQGSVQIDKNTGLGFENAFLNLPVTQGAQVRTGNNGRAEIEFEDGSSMRLAPNTTVDFSKLGVSDEGKRISEVNLTAGMAYVNWLGKDDFSLAFAHETISLGKAAHFRLDTSSNLSNLAVFKGDVEVQGPGGTITVEKKKTAIFDASSDQYKVENKITEEPLDSWDKQSIEYHDEYAKNKNNSSPYAYGGSDLNYYGAYSNVPGYGMMWQPYFAGIGWDPFMDGVWSWYPGFGYMFASAYPWGWMPFMYGNWAYAPGFGWGWQPGGWNRWHPVAHYTPTNLVRVNALVPPTNGTKTVAVGHGGVSTAQSPRFTVHSGSAGLGIARGSLGNLKGLNHQVEKTGFAQVRPAPQFGASSPHYSTGTAEGRSSMASPSMGMGRASAPAAHASAPAAGTHH